MSRHASSRTRKCICRPVCGRPSDQHLVRVLQVSSVGEQVRVHGETRDPVALIRRVRFGSRVSGPGCPSSHQPQSSPCVLRHARDLRTPGSTTARAESPLGATGRIASSYEGTGLPRALGMRPRQLAPASGINLPLEWDVDVTILRCYFTGLVLQLDRSLNDEQDERSGQVYR